MGSIVRRKLKVATSPYNWKSNAFNAVSVAFIESIKDAGKELFLALLVSCFVFWCSPKNDFSVLYALDEFGTS